MDARFTIRLIQVTIFAFASLACIGAAPAATPGLSIAVSKVRVTMNLAVGAKYQLLATKDLKTWVTVGEPFLALAELEERELDVVEVGRFFQIQKLDRPADPVGPADAPPEGFVRIPAGTFVMGSPTTEKARSSVETQHTVTISHDFYMSKYEVTQREYLATMGVNPSYFTTKDWIGNPISPDLNRPVESVSWNDSTDYCTKLTASEKEAGRLPEGLEYRLPTEAEWEYACRAGTSTALHYGNDLRSGMANFYGLTEYDGDIGIAKNPNGTYLARTTAVGSYAPNAFGLYDMHGNVSEWCLDGFREYAGGSLTDPRGPISDSTRVVRGGPWLAGASSCRSAKRSYTIPGQRVSGSSRIGFRPVLAPAQ